MDILNRIIEIQSTTITWGSEPIRVPTTRTCVKQWNRVPEWIHPASIMSLTER